MNIAQARLARVYISVDKTQGSALLDCMQGMFGNAIFCCVLLLGAAAGVLGSHFRGGIFMVRPQPGGNETEVKPTMYLRLGGGYITDISKLLEIFAVEHFAVFAMY